MQSAIIIALLVVMAIYLCYWGRAKRERRRRLRLRIALLRRWQSRLIQTMRQPPTDGLPRCQTENDLLVESFRSVERAEQVLKLAEQNCRLWLDPEQPAIGAVRSAELDLVRADCLLKTIQGNLRPLIGRMRQAASHSLTACTQIMDIALQTDPDSIKAESLCPVIHATEMAAEVAKQAPVRALNEHSLMLRGAILNLDENSSD